MSILVTGGAGFIGGALCKRLDSPDVFDRRRGLDLRLHHIPSARFCYHLAANSDISKGAINTWPDYGNTVDATYELTESVRCPIVYLSGSGVYGDTGGDPVTEHSPLTPISMYGAAKICAEMLLRAYAERTGQRVWILRPCNIVGPGMTHGLVYDVVRNLQRDPLRLAIKGNGAQTKPYLHVEDLCDAMQIIQSAPSLGRVIVQNVPGNARLTVRSIVTRICARMGVAPTISYGAGREGWPGDVPNVDIRGGDLLRIAGWTPARDAWHAIDEAVDWLQENRA